MRTISCVFTDNFRANADQFRFHSSVAVCCDAGSHLFFQMNCVSIFPTQCHTAGRWQVNQNVGAHINGLVFFYFLLCVCVLTRALFLFYLYFLEKNYYKHSVFYRAKTITKINGRNLTAICLANVSVRDCFLRLSIYCIPSSSSSSSFFLFLFLISVS